MKTKVRKASPVYIPVAIMPILEEIAKDKEGLIFDYGEKKFYTKYYSAIKMAGCRKLTPYSCRHTTATALAITMNVAPETIRKIMRWTTTAMLKRYAHPDQSAVFDAIDKM